MRQITYVPILLHRSCDLAGNSFQGKIDTGSYLVSYTEAIICVFSSLYPRKIKRETCRRQIKRTVCIQKNAKVDTKVNGWKQKARKLSFFFFFISSNEKICSVDKEK